MRFRAILLALAGVALLPSLAARAQTAPGFTAGPEAGYYSYRESGLRIAGPIAGLDGSWTSGPGFWVLPYNLFLRIEGIGDLAYVDYSSESSGRLGGVVDLKGEARALFGDDLTVGSSGVVLTPFLGVGYRALYDMEGGSTTSGGALGYNRLSQYLYAPLGISVGIPCGEWRITPTLEADYLIQGWQTSYVRNVGFDSNITNVQQNGYGFRGSVMLAAGRFAFGPYARFWKIGQSDTATLTSAGKIVGFAVEPSNRTVEAGLALAIHF